MKLKLYYILSNDVFKIFTLTYEGDSVTIDTIGDIIQKAKRKFNLPGKMYTVLAGGKVFHVGKVKNVWKAYELLEDSSD